MSQTYSRKIINFKNFHKRSQSYYLIYNPNQVNRLKLEQVIYEFFKTSENETQFPFIQYIAKGNKIINFEDLQNHESYFVYISTGRTKCFNFDPDEVKETLISNEITVLSEEEYLKFLDMTNLLSLKERTEALNQILEKENNKILKNNEEFLSMLLNYTEKIENQKEYYLRENEELNKIENEFRIMADQYNKLRISVEKNLFYYQKEK